jgi:hypothetical protein
MFIHVPYIYVHVYISNMACLAGQLKKFNWCCAPWHQSSPAHQNRACRSTCPLLIATWWTLFSSKVVGAHIQDCSSCPVLAANQTGRVDWRELAGWAGISWQSWSAGRAWQWLDPSRAESYTACSCCWWCLDIPFVCGMGVNSVQGRGSHLNKMLSIWYPKTKLSWNESKGND